MAGEEVGKNGKLRKVTQAVSFAFSNGYVHGWTRGKIYTGPEKRFCLPGLNCYSCPGAVAACPVGALQAVLSSPGYRFSLYVLGFIGMCGMLLGRFVCGWLCPFGFIQELLHRIPLFRKTRNLPGHRKLIYLKYAVLVLFVLILPAWVRGSAGTGEPWFCEYVCPAGTLLGGIPLLIANETLRSGIRWRFLLKTGILTAIVLLSVKAYRPFCKYLCPLGALYSLANPVSLYRLSVDTEKCTRCGRCHEVCGMDVKVWETPNSPECIRCGKCIAVCPRGAVESTFEKAEKRLFADKKR